MVKQSIFRSLYFQVLVAIAIGVVSATTTRKPGRR